VARTQAEIEADLRTVRRQKTLPQQVAFADRSQTSRSMEEWERLEASLINELAAVTSQPRPKQTLIVASKGL
jgi:hypothetical protein